MSFEFFSVTDTGRGLPTGFDSEASGNLGLSIVRTLVIGDLDGVLEFGPRADGSGTTVVVDVPLKEEQPKRPRSSAGPVGWNRSGGANPCPGVATLQCASLVLTQAAPDSVVLAGFEGPR